jgi:hypothetical protein
MAIITRAVGVGQTYDPNSYGGADAAKNKAAIDAALATANAANLVAAGDIIDVVLHTPLGSAGWAIGAASLAFPTGANTPTTDANNYLRIRGAAKMSYAVSDALRPDVTKGAVISSSGDYNPVVVDAPQFTRFADLALRCTHANPQVGPIGYVPLNKDMWRFDRVMLWAEGASGAIDIRDPDFYHCLIWLPRMIIPSGSTVDYANCTFVWDRASGGIWYDYINHRLRNCIVANRGAVDPMAIGALGTGATIDALSTNNSSTTAPGSVVANLATNYTQFSSITTALESVTVASEDLRTKSTATMVRGNGVDATAWTLDGDIRGASLTATPDRGAWQSAAAALLSSVPASSRARLLNQLMLR